MTIRENRNLGLFLLRLALAAVFIVHGWMKLNGLDSTEAFFGQVGIPAAGAMAVVVALIEFLGGLALLLGVATQWASLLIAIVMAVAILQVKFNMGFVGGYELDLTLLLAALAVMFAGPGEWTVARMMRKNS